jgi:hypothetical protein
LWGNEYERSSWLLKFIKAVIKKDIVIFQQKRVDIEARLEELGYPKLKTVATGDDDDNNDKKTNKKDTKSYIYLLSTKIDKFTKEKIKKLENDLKETEEKINVLKGKTTKDLYIEDLESFKVGYEDWDAKKTAAHNAILNESETETKKRQNKTKPKRRNSKK